MDFDKNTKQHVTSDPNLNVVQYKIQNTGQKTWVVNDFNKVSGKHGTPVQVYASCSRNVLPSRQLPGYVK